MNAELKTLREQAQKFATTHADGERDLAASQGTTWNAADYERAHKQLEIRFVLREVLPAEEQLFPVFGFLLDTAPTFSALQREYIATTFFK